MFLIIFASLLALWLLWSGIKFYRQINWGEAPEPSPDLQSMHKKQAELMRIQELLTEACKQGKLPPQTAEDVSRYCDNEIAQMQAVETAWKNRHN